VHARAGWTVSVGFSATDVCAPDDLVSSCDIALARAAEAGGNRAVAGLAPGRVQA
jgi:hypothetical protein